MKFGPFVLGACLAVVMAAAPSEAQLTTTKSSGAAPCCGILSVNTASGLVVAQDKAGKANFLFAVRDGALLKSLRVGQSVAADFGSGRVTVNGATPCCGIIETQLDPAEPCCSVTAINLATGVVTARIEGATFNFTVKDARLLRSLKIGQQVAADFVTNKVRIHGAEPCCNIITQ